MKIKLAIGATVSQTIRAFYCGQLDYMVDQGYDITIITSPDPTLIKDVPTEVKLHFVDFSRQFTPLRDLKTFIHLVHFFRTNHFDMLQYSTPKSTLLCSIAGWTARIPCRLYCMWGIYYSALSGWKRLFFKSIEKMVCTLSTHISPDGKDNRSFAIQEGLFPASKSSVMGEGSANGIDLDRFNPDLKHEQGKQIRKELGIGQDDIVIGTVTRLIKNKGIEELVSAFLKLSGENPHLHLILVGPREDYLSPLSDKTWQIIQNHLKIHWVGPQQDVPSYYASMDIFVLPTYREGFGIVNLEASAMKLPVISTDVNGPRESIIAEKTGLLVPVKEIEPLYQAIKRLVFNPELRKKMGEAGRMRVVESFDAKIMRRLWDEHRKKLLAAR